MIKEYWQIQLSLGLLVIGLSLFHLKFGADRTNFRWLFLVGYMAVVGGVIASGGVSVWIDLGASASWFIVAGYFYYQERKERSERKARP